MRSERAAEQRHNAQREARFLAERDRQRERLDDLAAELGRAEAQADQPVTQHLEDSAFAHGVHVGHRHEQEQKQFGEFRQVLADRDFEFGGLVGKDVFDADDGPDEPGGQHDRL